MILGLNVVKRGEIATIQGRDVPAKPSSRFTFSDLKIIADTASQAAQEADGVVITQGVTARRQKEKELRDRLAALERKG